MKTLITCIVISFSLAAFAAGEKVVDASARKAPSWVYGMESGYIITTAEGTTMEQARVLAMQAVKERIVSSVAEHIESETATMMKETITEEDIEAYSAFSKQIRSQSADIPFIKNISEANVEDYYWEKVRVDKDMYVYRYNIKYPFSSLEIRLIIREFENYRTEQEAKEKALKAQIAAFANEDFARYSCVEDMLKVVNELELLMQTLPANDIANSNACYQIQQKYKKMFGMIELRVLATTREYTDVALYYGDKRIRYAKTPKLKSDCLTELSYTPIETGGRVAYNFEYGCYEGEQNALEISYLIYGQRIHTTVYIMN